MQEVLEKIIEEFKELESMEFSSFSKPLISIEDAIRMVEVEAEKYNGGWIPCSERMPEDGEYILVSFENYTLPDIARYEEDKDGGAFYPGDEERSYVSYGLFVNAWQPLPESYRPEE
ncbi:MAG: DUF551 domain-containing protein [Dorea sp.]|jgi:hypothetical protein|nr:DUF551 domain-containing protein [Dorea sp.]